MLYLARTPPGTVPATERESMLVEPPAADAPGIVASTPSGLPDPSQPAKPPRPFSGRCRDLVLPAGFEPATPIMCWIFSPVSVAAQHLKTEPGS